MTLKKRGLGRGLEVLLADTSTMDDLPQPSTGAELANNQAVMALALLDDLQKEKQNLLLEAEALKSLLDEFESIIRARQ
ncbi:MAG: hypothetical protein PHR16_08170 [Methylovulum sp.]|nr:hypothetical protein [Methylovulum sp.]